MRKIHFILLALAGFILVSCGQSSGDRTKDGSGKLQVVTTTTMITDLLQQIGTDKIDVYGLMGPGVDPHLYKASEGDVSRLFNADLIFYNGVHLEGKMTEIFEKMAKAGTKTYAVGSSINEDKLLEVSDGYAQHDPHIWFDVEIWETAANFVARKLIANDPENKDIYTKSLTAYLVKLQELQQYNLEMIGKIPLDDRILITAHDAFEYFGRAYNFEVLGLQGISTVSEAGAADVRDLAAFIYEHRIPAIFIESSVPKRNIEALQAAVKSRGLDVKIGGELFSDALGSPDTSEGTYIGMYKHNVSTIVNALKK